jgi:hypothetical protein
MEKLLRDIEEEAHLEAERLRREAEESRSNPSSPGHHARRSEPAEGDEEDDAPATGRTRSNSNRTDSADDKTVTSPDRLFPGLTPLATKPSFTEQDVSQSVTRKSRIPVKVQNSIGEGPSSSPSASVRKAQPTKSTDHAAVPVLGSRSMPAVHASKQLLSFSSFVKLLWKVIAECIRMELTSDLVAAIRKIIKNKKRYTSCDHHQRIDANISVDPTSLLIVVFTDSVR